MTIKNADKLLAKSDNTVMSITFDLQAVLTTPFAGDAQIYYLRKLSAYNFTIYESASHRGHCYIWDETEGGRGSNEVSTCLLMFIKSLPPVVTHLSTFSDTCGGQNRNQFICAAMIHATRTTQMETIDLKYMESGHSYLEADSMHSTIERAKRHQKIYTTREWEILIAGSKKSGDPYIVNRLGHEDFYDVKELSKNIMMNRNRNTDGDVVQWLKVKHLRFQKSKPYVISYRYNLDDETFLEMNVRTQRRGRRSQEASLKAAYTARLPISSAKKKDLLKLLKDGVIPKEYTQFYTDLPTSDDVRDTLPMPSADEPDDGNNDC